MDQELLERMVKEVMASLAGNKTVNNEESPSGKSLGLFLLFSENLKINHGFVV